MVGPDHDIMRARFASMTRARRAWAWQLNWLVIASWAIVAAISQLWPVVLLPSANGFYFARRKALFH
jgi:hypothetical protein